MEERLSFDMAEKDLHWLSGILEGEGTFLHGPPSQPNNCAIGLQMTDEDVVRRSAQLVDATVWRSERNNKDPKGKPYKTIFGWKIHGKRAITFMKILKPLMGIRRAQKIQDIINGFKWTNRGDNAKRLDEIKIKEIVEKRNKGSTFDELATEYQVSRPTIRYHYNKWKKRSERCRRLS